MKSWKYVPDNETSEWVNNFVFFICYVTVVSVAKSSRKLLHSISRIYVSKRQTELLRCQISSLELIGELLVTGKCEMICIKVWHNNINMYRHSVWNVCTHIIRTKKEVISDVEAHTQWDKGKGNLLVDLCKYSKMKQTKNNSQNEFLSINFDCYASYVQNFKSLVKRSIIFYQWAMSEGETTQESHDT